jgi:AcrR family transcriptional regulator
MDFLSRKDKTEKRRQIIIEAAAVCFIAKGFHQTSMRDIATTAGVSLGNLYNHFASKSDLIGGFADMEAEETAEYVAYLEKSAPSLKAVQKLLDQIFETVSERGNTVLTMEVLSEATRNSDILDLFMKNQTVIGEAFGKFIAQGQQSGVFDQQLAPEETAHILLQTTEGLALNLGVLARKQTKAEKQARHLSIVKILT